VPSPFYYQVVEDFEMRFDGVKIQLEELDGLARNINNTSTNHQNNKLLSSNNSIHPSRKILKVYNCSKS